MVSISCQPFGQTAGQPITRFLITDASGNTASLINFGAVLQGLSICKPDGQLVDVCLGYDTPEEYQAANSCFGSTMGRCTGRIANCQFTLSGTRYILSENRKGFHIHGGFEGFHKKVWNYEQLPDGIRFTYHSPDGEEGYPGNLTATIAYRWIREGVLAMDYDCVSDRETVINLTNHSYFNLDGHASGTILEHRLQIFSDSYAETAENSIPTGVFLPVAGTPLDFTQPNTIGSRIQDAGNYDHNYRLTGGTVAKLWGGRSGIAMTVSTDFPALGLYAAHGLVPQPGKDGAQYAPYHGVCLETQYLPNSMNLPQVSPQPIFQPGQHFRHRTEFQFSFEP